MEARLESAKGGYVRRPDLFRAGDPKETIAKMFLSYGKIAKFLEGSRKQDAITQKDDLKV